MTALTDEITQLLEKCSEEEQREVLAYLRKRIPLHSLETEWNTSAEFLLTAIARSSDLTQRGIRGILAETTFDQLVIPRLAPYGWKQADIQGDKPYDFLLRRGGVDVRVQVKLQRKEAGVPRDYAQRSRARLLDAPEKLYCVEVQKTRSGKKNGKSTRPYRFGDFDILAVNLHPSTGDWERFVYTVASWLLKRKRNPRLIEIFQPVPSSPDDYWTDDFSLCAEWLRHRGLRQLYKK